MSMQIKNLKSCCGAAGHQGQGKYTNYWDLNQIEPNKKKQKKYKMSG